MERILLIESDKKLADLLAEYLTRHGFAVWTESRGDRAVYRIFHESYSLVILEANLLGLDGYSVCKLARKSYSGFIIMLTASEFDENHLASLKCGADDCIKKPIQPKILLKHIITLLRRGKSSATLVNKLIFGNLSIDMERREVKFKKIKIQLKASEFDLLVLLAMNAGKKLTQKNIIQSLSGVDEDQQIEARISHLRKKLADDLELPFRIKTTGKMEYCFQPDVWG